MGSHTPEITLVSPFEDITAYGVRLLSAILRREGYSTKIVFMPYILREGAEDSLDALAEKIQQISAGSSLLGFSFFTCHFPFVAKLSSKMREKVKIPIVWGGKHITPLPQDAVGYADIVCIGESEISLKSLLQAVGRGEDYRSLAGVWKVGEGDPAQKALPPVVEDLDALPYPDYSQQGHYLWDGSRMLTMDDKVLEAHVWKSPNGRIVYHTMASRGCLYSCTYCSTFKDLYKGQKYLRMRSIENVVDEIGAMVARFPFVGEVHLSDDNFFAMKDEQLEDFARLYKQRVGLPLRCLGHPQDVTRKKLEVMIDAGMNEFQIGIQTGCKNTQKLYRRGPSAEKVLETVKLLNSFKGRLRPFYDFIIDNPYESKEDVLETLRMINQFPHPYHLNVFSLIFLPGTELHRKAMKDGMIFDMTRIFEFRKESYLNIIFHIYNLGLPRWFTGLLISKPVVALLDNRLAVSAFYSLRKMVKKVLKA
ncbi:MAG: B12-binding domain-containing radical SAM protein [Alphaproteobacteria bacterium]|uniref:B12-binding domain-containing radical SAM protein n=1 Tax=Candidatus Nitrobium versatile TaxID=2884831 RepID=A0A953JAC1_9BACT|nr:B12-binding domain-containing radical SAM protein [Candidatus Nitrobium versatile]